MQSTAYPKPSIPPGGIWGLNYASMSLSKPKLVKNVSPSQQYFSQSLDGSLLNSVSQ